MCGLLTMFGDTFADDFDDALDTLASRGPDERGVWVEPEAEQGGVRLGHRRLSIIDLAAGQQPMALAPQHPLHDRYRIVYNGELYNAGELRDQLEAKGHPFATRCDTEVLLAGFVEWGADVLPRLDGMFAFAVYDRRERCVFAARDFFGIKPLMVHASGGGLILSSTLAPFFRLRRFPRRLDPAAVREYLACQSVPSPMTILRGVRSLEPGTWLRWTVGDERGESGRFETIPGPSASQPSPDDFIEATDAALRESVRRQLVADVPLGAFLSGGIDSSLMVRYMADTASGSVKTFSVRFPFGKGYDESGAAEAVAERFGCEHHVLDARDITGDALAAAWAELDQPLADPAYLPTRALAELTRRHVTVAVSGDGGDELFGGYDRYALTEDRYPDTPGRRAIRQLVAARLLPGAMGRRGLAGRERMLWDRVKLGPFPGTRKDMIPLLSPDFRGEARVGDTMGLWLGWLNCFAEDGAATADTLMRADLHSYLSENCLAKTDRASMAHSLEVRVPMLGRPVADVALPVHASVKLANGPKSALVALAKRHLPGAVWDRPKHGFSVPLRGYFAGAWRDRCNDWLARCETLAPFLDARAVRRRWRRGDDTRTLYTLIGLLAWLDLHDVDV
ncbi:MAG: asparagine synthase (glutamine-hydrolyzing) [Planctomycetota bacterium]